MTIQFKVAIKGFPTAALLEKVKEGAKEGCETFITGPVQLDSLMKCPILTGAMKADHRPEPTETGTKLIAEGKSAAYVVKQHQDSSLRHRDGKTDHWMSNALNKNINRLPELVARAIEGRLG
jgi:hypothetical protein